jgi:hypothetical protein
LPDRISYSTFRLVGATAGHARRDHFLLRKERFQFPLIMAIKA